MKYAPVNKKVDTAVKQYTKAIVNAAKEYKEDIDIDIDISEALNVDEDQSSTQALIKTELGVVIVLPDFKKMSAQATVVKLGIMKALKDEGFDEEFINTNGEIYGSLLTKSQKNAKVFGYYLTHKIDPTKI
jgi:hypothetical protein